ncbi:MAG: hypothetical protein P8L85_20655 [Rubripirellula sp.]|nr:hypothetical protein [Rubripirellula sp.]
MSRTWAGSRESPRLSLRRLHDPPGESTAKEDGSAEKEDRSNAMSRGSLIDFDQARVTKRCWWSGVEWSGAESFSSINSTADPVRP